LLRRRVGALVGLRLVGLLLPGLGLLPLPEGLPGGQDVAHPLEVAPVQPPPVGDEEGVHVGVAVRRPLVAHVEESARAPGGPSARPAAPAGARRPASPRPAGRPGAPGAGGGAGRGVRPGRGAPSTPAWAPAPATAPAAPPRAVARTCSTSRPSSTAHDVERTT